MTAVQVLDALNSLAWYLNRLAGWLGRAGVETEADMIDQAAKDLLASCWLLERPLRPKPPPEVWKPVGTGLGVPYQQAPDQQR
jgi:hypothetical protein